MDKTKKYEGFRKNVYRDSVGVKTIGSGINLQEKHNQKILPKDVVSGKRAITPEEDEKAFEANQAIADKDARNFVGENYDNLDPEAQSVIKDMHYNMGAPRMKSFVKLQAAAKAGDYDGMANEIQKSKYAKQVGSRAQDHIDALRNIKKQKDTEAELVRQIRPNG